MRTPLLGLALEDALRILRGEGVEPAVTLTCAPGRPREGAARVVYASDDGLRLTAAVFAPPLEEEN